MSTEVQFPRWWRKLLVHLKPKTDGLTISGTNTFTGTQTFTGTNTFSGPVTLSDLQDAVLTKEYIQNKMEQFEYIDHFAGDLLRDEWDCATTTGAESTYVVTAGAGGQLVIDTVGTAEDATVGWGSTGMILDPSKGLYFECRMKMSVYAAGNRGLLQWGLYKDSDEYAMFEVDYNETTGAINIDMKADGGAGTPTDSASGVMLDDTDWHRYGIYCDTSGNCAWYIDNSLKYTTQEIGALSTTSEGQLMGPHFYLSDSGAAQMTMIIDYVAILQESGY